MAVVAPKTVIIGGGVAGLTAAFRLSDRRPLLIEAEARSGGQVHTELADGFVVERGAEGFVARSQAIPNLVRELGMPDEELVGQAIFRSYGFDGERLVPLLPGQAAGFLGFQVPADDLGKGIRSLRRGMASLVWALCGNLDGRAELRLRTRALAVEPRGSGTRVRLESGVSLDADALVVATSAAAAASLLEPLAGEAARALSDPKTHSSVTVELAFERAMIEHPLDGTGFVVAPGAQRDGLRACTFTSSKFLDRAPGEKVSLRLFFRPEEPEAEWLAHDNAFWIERAIEALARVLPVRARPLGAWVSRWPRALPVFDAAHRAAVTELERSIAPFGVVLAGAAFHGSGLDAAVSSGERAAAALTSSTSSPAG
jgi:oxygen-dependent protoporphyrinogen oxidase